MQVTACLLLLTWISVSAMAQNTINIGFIYSGSGQYITDGVRPAVGLAVELVNNRTDLLPEYQLNISYTRDSECNSMVSQKVFLESQLSEPTGPDNLALLGCGCSLATEPVAQISHHWNLIHMSYVSSSDVLNDKTRFPNFWRTYPVESNLAEPVLAVMNLYGWKKIKILSQDELIFTTSTSAISSTLTNNSVQVVMDGTTRLPTDNAFRSDIFSPEVRVYLLNMYPRQARRVFCAAARAREGTMIPEFQYEKYVWITIGWYGEDWWKTERMTDDAINCTDSDVEQFLPNTLAILQANTAENSSATTDVDLTAAEFGSQNRALLDSLSLSYEHSAFHAYDAVWTLAFALNRTVENGTNLTDYSRLGGSGAVDTIQAYLRNTSFTGVSGQVQFDATGTRVADVPRVLKYRDSTVTNNCGKSGPASIERVRVGKVSQNNGSSVEYSVCEDTNTTWPDGVPSDGLPVTQVIPILTPLVVVYYTLATIGITFAIICFLFNVIFRNRKIVKLISPNLNYCIILGAIFLYAAIYFYVFPSLDKFWVTFACHFRAWLQISGIFLAYGTIVLKVWRVHYIFSNPTVSKKRKSRIPKDWQLFIVVCVMLLGVAIFLSAVAAFGDYKATVLPDKERKTGRDDNGNLVAYQNLVCEGPNSIIWIAILFGAILLVLLTGVVLAFRTRKVEIKALNDYKYISAITYLGTIILVVMIVSAGTLDEYLNTDAAIYGTLLFLFTTLCLSLTFIPKMVILYKDPKGERIFQRSMSQAGTIIARPEDDSTRYLELEHHCRELEGRLAKCGEVVPTFRPRAESSIKLKSSSFSSIPPSSPMYRTGNPTLSLSAPSTPTRTLTTNTQQLNAGSSDYFTETERNSTASSNEPKDVENGKV